MKKIKKKPVHYKVSLRNKTTRTVREVVVTAFNETQAKLAALPGDKEIITDVKIIDRFEAMARGEIFQFKPNTRDILLFLRDLSTLLKMGIPMVKALRLEIGVAQNVSLRASIAQIIGLIEEGKPLSEAMASQDTLFDNTVVALIKAGEASGELPKVLKDMAIALERSYKIFRKLKQAMIYPCIVMIGCAVVVYIFSYKLVPALAKIYLQFGADLPTTSKIVIAFSNMIRTYPVLAPIPALIPFLIIISWKKIYAKPWVQKFCIRVPRIGVLIRKAAITKSLRTMAMLSSAVVDIRQNLELCAISCGHVEYTVAFRGILKHVENGETLHEGFAKKQKALGPDGPQLAAFIQSAQESGTITETLENVAQIYEEDLDEMATNISTIIEPVIFIFMAAVVGVLLYAVYSPIFNLSNVILKK